MSCFIVPLTQAAVTTAMRRRASKNNNVKPNAWLQNLPKLELMLWGGTAMLIVDHIINGEITWQYPFFTALEQKGGAMTMLSEMLTVGVPMSILITLIYSWMVYHSLKVKSEE